MSQAMNRTDAKDAAERAAAGGLADNAADLAWTADAAIGYEAADPARFAAEWTESLAGEAGAAIARRPR